jgi:2-polyprenyl-3-methyl-5-hydroxy-6-metoxy-1,4-benzoquinol methylase
MLGKRTRNPFGFLRRVIEKAILGPRRYGRGDDYDAAAYWRDRFDKYGQSLRGAGHEGLSEDVNRDMYEEAAKVFADLCRKESLDYSSARVLDIGCGNGFYAGLLSGLGVREYSGLDITDVLFELILMIDVVEHIVTEPKLSRAMANVKRVLAPGGLFVISGLRETGRRKLFYVRSWSLEEIIKEFPGYQIGEAVAFRDSTIIPIRKPKE